ncbi:hypothetical protein Rs2_42401 [Raphanus sativus]|uniref:UPF0540 protein At1g62060-like n=1 Tax=Raphanus sativus TaxID=3726 RepID=A0A6J0KY39_RAPSA|nr:UPF0540 protein At1g62060-like [Raphanus sativus]KAJ4877383.1 hypothetical protein Rs2_42401 [Raphanus sativus]
MNVMKFVVLLIFVGVVCANVGARQLQEMFKETKLGISIPKTVTTNGIGAELGLVYVTTSATNSENSNAGAAAGAGGPSASGSGTVYKSTYGTVNAEGPNARANSYSYVSGSTGAGAAAGPNGAGSNGYAAGVAYSNADGSTSDP